MGVVERRRLAGVHGMAVGGAVEAAATMHPAMTIHHRPRHGRLNAIGGRPNGPSAVGGNLSLNATAVGGVADRRQDGLDGLDQACAHLGLGRVQRRLNDVVGVGVSKHLLQLVRVEHLLDHQVRDGRFCMANTLLDDIGAELVLGQTRNAGLEAVAHGVRERGIVEVDDILQHIVSVRILYKGEGVLGDLSDEVSLLRSGRVVNAALKDTASMTVAADSHTAPANGVEDELRAVSQGKVAGRGAGGPGNHRGSDGSDISG